MQYVSRAQKLIDSITERVRGQIIEEIKQEEEIKIKQEI